MADFRVFDPYGKTLLEANTKSTFVSNLRTLDGQKDQTLCTNGSGELTFNTIPNEGNPTTIGLTQGGRR